ncbi:hypothetical protein HPB47_019509, partial [Ixodes persulcatus]
MENSDGEPSSKERPKSGPSTAALAKDQAGQPGQQGTSGQAVKGVKRRKGANDDEPDDDDQEEDIGASEATSDSTMHVDDEKSDLEGFILVTHRRHRTTGVPVLLTPVNDDQRLQKQNPLKLSEEIAAAADAPLALGHIAKYCKNAVKCKKCAGQHETKECKGEDPVKCANCGGDHPASYVNCKVRLGALARSKAFVNGPRQALKPVETVEVNDTAASQKSPVAT